ncbi:hypothetical protein KSS87_016891 [Heliosperma pusillum]|nr:hypothetical protein KSS87_016891 [Heliosperma pusillum]
MPLIKLHFGFPPFFKLHHINFSSNMLTLRFPPQIKPPILEFIPLTNIKSSRNVIVCGLKGPRPRYPRVWKTQKRIGTASKSNKLVHSIKGLSNVKEEVYGALDAFIAWELEFPLITVKKALKTLENEKEWKRVIQVTKWMLSKGQGRTMGSYFTLLNALSEEDRLEEAEELWRKLFTKNLESTPRMFFEKMITIYYIREMHDKMFDLNFYDFHPVTPFLYTTESKCLSVDKERDPGLRLHILNTAMQDDVIYSYIFADMEELGTKPTVSIVSKVGDVFRKLGMMDKYQKLHQKYPPPKWEFKYIQGKRVKVRTQLPGDTSDGTEYDRLKLEASHPGEDPNRLDEECDQ